MSDFVKNYQKLFNLVKTSNISTKMPRRKILTMQFAAKKKAKQFMNFLKSNEKLNFAKSSQAFNKMPRRRVFTIQFSRKSGKKCLVF